MGTHDVEVPAACRKKSDTAKKLAMLRESEAAVQRAQPKKPRSAYQLFSEEILRSGCCIVCPAQRHPCMNCCGSSTWAKTVQTVCRGTAQAYVAAATVADTSGSLRGHPSSPQQVRLYVDALHRQVLMLPQWQTIVYLHAHGHHITSMRRLYQKPAY